MTDPLFTPLKSHPSTWQAEVAQLRDENTDLILQAMASNAQAAEAHEARLVAEDRYLNLADKYDLLSQRFVNQVEQLSTLRAKNARLIEERDRALAWRDKDWQASKDNEALRARVATLEAALERIACCRVTRGWLWWQHEARAALEAPTQPHSAKSVPRRG